MITDLLFIFFGIFVGICASLSPSVSVSILLLLFYPLLYAVSSDALISFYVVSVTTVYFCSSVLGLWLGILGDPTSFPVVNERDNILKNNQLGLALKRTAQAGIISSLLSVILLILFVSFIGNVVEYFIMTYTSLIVFLVMILIAICWKENNLITNILLTILGLLVSNIGHMPVFDVEFLSFSHHWLYGGIPVIPVIMGIFAIPIILMTLKSDFTERKSKKSYNNFRLSIPNKNVELLPTLRGTFIGFFVGLIPLIGGAVQSNVAYSIERKLKNSTPLKNITSAEAANNASAISVLIPLLVLGVAILPGELIILYVMENKGWTIHTLTNSTYYLLIFSLVITISLCYFLCVRYARSIIFYFYHYKMYLISVFLVFLVYGVFYIGNLTFQETYYLLTLCISLIIGLGLNYYKINTIPFVITFLIGDKFIEIIFRSTMLLYKYF